MKRGLKKRFKEQRTWLRGFAYKFLDKEIKRAVKHVVGEDITDLGDLVDKYLTDDLADGYNLRGKDCRERSKEI